MLNQRILPSASPVDQPPAALNATPMAAEMEAYVHQVAAVEEDLVGAIPVFGAELAAEVGYFARQWDLRLGFTPAIASPVPAPSPSSGSGSGGGSMSTAHDGPITEANGHSGPSQGGSLVTMLSGSGTGSGSGSTSGNGSGIGSGSSSGSALEVYFTSGSYTLPEGTGSDSVGLPVDLSGLSSQTVTVHYQTSNGTAIAGTDYTAESGTLSIAGDLQGFIYLTIPDDGESDDIGVGSGSGQYFDVTLSNPSGAILGTPSIAVVNIQEDYPSNPTVYFYSSGEDSVAEGSGSGSAELSVELTGSSSQTVTVQYQTSNGTATAGIDYSAESGTLTFQPGEWLKNISVPILDDGPSDDDVGSESFDVTLSNPSGANLESYPETPSTVVVDILEGNGSGTGSTPSVYFGSGSYSVGEGSGSGSAVVEVDLSAASSQSVTVQYQTSDGTATAGVDYTAENSSVSFAPGQVVQSFAIPILDDGASDANVSSEQFTVSLSSPSNATLGTPSTANVNITERATLSGQVWLDNNGDGSLDDNEMDYSGAGVNLYSYDATTNTTTLLMTTTTTSNTSGKNFQFVVPADDVPGEFEVQVGIPQNFYATKPGGDSIINAKGFFADANGNPLAFALAAGGEVNVGKGGLASTVVTTTEDDVWVPIQNEVTLRDAMETANNPRLASPTITFKDGLSGAIQLDLGLPAIENNVTINGPGMAVIAVVSPGDGPVFRVDTGITAAINNVSIENGKSALDGGGVANLGNLTLSDDRITHNHADGNGGGIFNGQGADLTLIDSIVANNTAANDNGGGILNLGTLAICCGTQIYSNQAENGGGLRNATSGTALITDDSAIYSNTAREYGGGIFNSGTLTMRASAGGAIKGNAAKNGGGIYNNLGSITLNGVAVSKNKAADGIGGGIFIAGGHLKMSRGAITSNEAEAYDGAPGGGGGVYVADGSLTLTGGVLVSLNKVGGGHGGGMYINKDGNVNVSGGTFQFNTTKTSGYNGGGIYNLSGTLTLKGGAYIGPQNSAYQGGGMYLGSNSITDFKGPTTVSGNDASAGGLGIYKQNGAGVFGLLDLTDTDDPDGAPFEGP